MSSYPVGLVGEAHHQNIIATCRAGDRVHVVHERGNPHDADALAVLTADGYKIGYISRDSWLREALHGEGKGCDAVIQAVGGPSGGCMGVVLDVSLTEGSLRSTDYPKPPSKLIHNIAVAGGIAAVLGIVIFGVVQERRSSASDNSFAASLTRHPERCHEAMRSAVRDRIVSRQRDNRIYVADGPWAEATDEQRRSLMALFLCSHLNGRQPRPLVDYVTAYGQRSGRRVALASSSGISIETP